METPHFTPASTAMPAPRRVALFGKSIQHDKCHYVVEVARLLQQLGVEVCIERRWADILHYEGGQQALEAFPIYDADRDGQSIDMAISMGGDGTFLSTAERLGHNQVPILGINMGRLGFLADVKPESIADALRLVVDGQYSLSHRSLIEVKLEGAELDVYPFALNEVAVLKHDNSSLIEVETEVDGQLLTNYVADGLIVSTPTGSTGYSLSVGGPVLAPESPAFCLAPVAPHSLTMRPIILSDAVRLKLKVKSRTGRFLIALDGRSRSLEAGTTTIHLVRAPYTVSVVKTAGNDFFHTLRDKMMWGVDQRN